MGRKAKIIRTSCQEQMNNVYPAFITFAPCDRDKVNYSEIAEKSVY